MVFQRFEYGTARFVSVSAVRETAILGEAKNLLEITCQFFRLHIEGAEALDTWGIHYPTPTLQRNHLRESRGVLTSVMGIGNLSCTEVNTRHKTVD
jgi:hypothetical protein